jgi:hypothetical protein
MDPHHQCGVSSGVRPDPIRKSNLTVGRNSTLYYVRNWKAACGKKISLDLFPTNGNKNSTL